MFTGIIEEIGKIVDIKKRGDLTEMSIQTDKILESAKIGDSISINGACVSSLVRFSLLSIYSEWIFFLKRLIV